MSDTVLNDTFLEKNLYASRKKNDLYKRYKMVHDIFMSNVLPSVTALANSTPPVIFLTDHGPDHVRAVIAKAGELARASRDGPTLYESFLLLIAILMHDVGNALGREEHEKKIDLVWSKVFGPLGFDELDKTIAVRIARAHGGSAEGTKDKDTIRLLDRQTMWKKENVRPQYLAALLRLADEMAEDRDRASRLGLELGVLPPPSAIFHAFASSLHSFSADPQACELRMSFAASADNFKKRFEGADGRKIYLLDEIFARSVKTFNEAKYCSRFLQGLLVFDKVRVSLDIYGKGEKSIKISFILEEQRHPSQDRKTTIYDLSPLLRDYAGSGHELSGRYLKSQLAVL